jgi:hypothetical protein
MRSLRIPLKNYIILFLLYFERVQGILLRVFLLAYTIHSNYLLRLTSSTVKYLINLVS